MDIHEIVSRYDRYLIREGVHDTLFDVSDDLVKAIYFKYEYPKFKLQYLDLTENQYDKLISTQLNYTRLSFLRVKYYRNGNSAKEIKEGYVYCVTNPAFVGYFKIGSSIDVKKRLSTYQSYSPRRDFNLESYYFSHDRFKEEKAYHDALCAEGEWIEGKIKPIKELFDSKKILGRIAQR